MKKQLLLLLLLTLLFVLLLDCSPRQRLDRLIRKHPDLIKTDSLVQIDSTVSSDTLVTDRQADTSFDYLQPIPLVLERNNIRLDIRIDTAKKRAYVSCNCRDTTITHWKTIREVYKYTRHIPPKARDPIKTWWLLWLVIGFASAVLLHSLLRKFVSPK